MKLCLAHMHHCVNLPFARANERL
eukprot:COSAG06_NODE_23330_length_691_cov_1.164430_1_plen_23_part_10